MDGWELPAERPERMPSPRAWAAGIALVGLLDVLAAVAFHLWGN